MLANQSVPLAANATDFAIDFAGGATFAPLVGEEVVLVVRVCHARLNPHPSHTRAHTHEHSRHCLAQVHMRQASLYCVGFAPERAVPLQRPRNRAAK